jgi:hypothetical protein
VKNAQFFGGAADVEDVVVGRGAESALLRKLKAWTIPLPRFVSNTLRTGRFMGSGNLQNSDANRGHEPALSSLTRPSGTLSHPMGEGTRFMGRERLQKTDARWGREPLVVQALACLDTSRQPEGCTTNKRFTVWNCGAWLGGSLCQLLQRWRRARSGWSCPHPTTPAWCRWRKKRDQTLGQCGLPEWRPPAG